MIKLIFVFVFVLFLSFSISIANAERIDVTIPTGAADPTFPTHYKPQEITARPGDFVRWLNGDTAIHTVTSGTLETGLDGKFDSGHLKTGEAFSFLFETKYIGENKYFCTLHPWLTGIVNVKYVEAGFKVIHNVGKGVSEKTFDVEYKTKRILVDAKIEPAKKTVTFTLSGIIKSDSLVLKLPDEMIKNPSSVWIDQKQITNFSVEKKDSIHLLTIPLTETAEKVVVMGTDIVGKIQPKKVTLINQIVGISDKKFYESGDSITISGEIKNPNQVFEISIEVISPTGQTVHSQVVPLEDGSKFSTIIPTVGVLRGFGEYDVKITGPSSKTLYLSFEYGLKKLEQLSPLKQTKMNISPEDVICNEGLQLMKKISNDSPICVTESTGEKLLARGWAEFFS